MNQRYSFVRFWSLYKTKPLVTFRAWASPGSPAGIASMRWRAGRRATSRPSRPPTQDIRLNYCASTSRPAESSESAGGSTGLFTSHRVSTRSSSSSGYGQSARACFRTRLRWASTDFPTCSHPESICRCRPRGARDAFVYRRESSFITRTSRRASGRGSVGFPRHRRRAR